MDKLTLQWTFSVASNYKVPVRCSKMWVTCDGFDLSSPTPPNKNQAKKTEKPFAQKIFRLITHFQISAPKIVFTKKQMSFKRCHSQVSPKHSQNTRSTLIENGKLLKKSILSVLIILHQLFCWCRAGEWECQKLVDLLDDGIIYFLSWFTIFLSG